MAALAVRTGGKGDVTKTHRLWTSKKGSNVSSPVYHDGHVYWMNDASGTAFCAKAATGEVVYEERVERAGQVYASALLADGRIYYVARDGRTFVVPPSRSTSYWRPTTCATAARSTPRRWPSTAGCSSGPTRRCTAWRRSRCVAPCNAARPAVLGRLAQRLR